MSPFIRLLRVGHLIRRLAVNVNIIIALHKKARASSAGLIARHRTLRLIHVIVRCKSSLEQTAPARAAHNLLNKVSELTKSSRHLLELLELRVLEVSQRVCLVGFNLAQTHVGDTVAHLPDIEQRWSQGLVQEEKVLFEVAPSRTDTLLADI